ncbi:MAG: DNA polymerase III subunit delta [Verrucomicrobia bacterium]|nr:DNA polymerase III subunit delta [Verrucomicrobiota bacterium]
MATPSIYLIYGNDEYLVSAKAKQIVAALVPEAEHMLKLDIVDGAVDTVDAAVSAIGACLASIQSLGLFSTEKVVWLQSASFLADNRTGKSATVLEHVQRLAALVKAGLPPGQVLVITASGVDKRRAFFKACKASGELHEFSIPEKSYQADRVAAEKLDQMLANAGLQMSSRAKIAFLEKVGVDTRQLINEVEKLAIFVGENREVDVAQVDAIVSSSREALAWDLADAFGKRELSRALAILRQLVFQKENVIGLVMGLENRIRELLIYREALERGWLVSKQGYGGRPSLGWGTLEPELEQIFAEQMGRDPRKIHPFRVSLLGEQARKFSMKRLRYCLAQVTEAHATLVSSRIPQEMTLEFLLIRMLATARG